MKKLVGRIPVLAIVGLAISGYLLWIYVTQNSLGCGVGCREVRDSSFSHLLGLPTPSWGLAFYLGLFVLSLLWNRAQAIDLRQEAEGDAEAAGNPGSAPAASERWYPTSGRSEFLGWGVLTWAAVGVFASGSLTYVEVAIVRALCEWCMVSALISLAVFFLALTFLFDRPAIEIDSTVLGHLAVFFVAVVTIVVGVSRAVSGLESNAPLPSPQAAAAPVDPKKLYDNARYAEGPADAPITLVEFIDFQCGSCAEMAKDLHQIVQRYPKKVRLIVRHYPLPGHSFAMLAAEAAEAAGAQGKFFEMYNQLMENQSQLWFGTGPKETRQMAGLKRIARGLGLDVDRFTRDVSSHKYKNVVEQDAADGRALGVMATPSLFLNNDRIQGPVAAATLISLIERRLKNPTSAGAVTPRDVSPASPLPRRPAGQCPMMR